MLQLDNITLCIIDCVDVKRALKVVNHCHSLANFGNTYIFSDESKPEGISEDTEFVSIDNLSSVEEVDIFISSSLYEYVKKDSCSHYLFVQWDGFILNQSGWSNKFLSYDFIGAPSEFSGEKPMTAKHETVPFFNSGFCLMSKLFLKELNAFSIELNRGLYPLDQVISGVVDIEGINFRDYALNLGLSFPDAYTASKFSIEYGIYHGSFGYHSTGFQHINDISLDKNTKKFNNLKSYKKNSKIDKIKDTTILNQIGYEPDQTSEILENFNFILNIPNSIFQENSIIARLTPNFSQYEFVGFFPYRVRYKLNNRFCYDHCIDAIHNNLDADILAPEFYRYGNHGEHHPRSIHKNSNMWEVFDLLCQKIGLLNIGQKAFEEPCRMIYTNSFIARYEIVHSYVQDCLIPALNMLSFDDEMYQKSREPCDYGFPVPKALSEVSGHNHWTHTCFLLERLLSLYCIKKNLKIAYCL